MDLKGVVESYSDILPLVGFLNRRRITWSSENDPKSLLLTVLKNLMRNNTELKTMTKVFDTLHLDGSEEIFNTTNPGIVPQALKLHTPLLQSNDIAEHVFK